MKNDIRLFAELANVWVELLDECQKKGEYVADKISEKNEQLKSVQDDDPCLKFYMKDLNELMLRKMALDIVFDRINCEMKIPEHYVIPEYYVTDDMRG